MIDPFSLVTVIRVRAASLSAAAELLLENLSRGCFVAPTQWTRADVIWKPLGDLRRVLQDISRKTASPQGRILARLISGWRVSRGKRMKGPTTGWYT